MENIFSKNYEATFKKVISGEVEKKGNFDYLSWAYAKKHLKLSYPEAITEQVNYPDANGFMVLPYLKTETGFFVTCRVYLTKQDFKDGIFQAFTHPVLDNRNRPLAKPDCFHINTSYMRCLTKGIAITTGLGLSLYAGEDLPNEVKDNNPEPQRAKEPAKKKDAPKDTAELELKILSGFKKKSNLIELEQSRYTVKGLDVFSSVPPEKINFLFEEVKTELAKKEATTLFNVGKSIGSLNISLDEIAAVYGYTTKNQPWLHDLYQEYASRFE